MAYSDKSGKIILEAWGKFKALAYEAMEPGDLVAPDASNDGWVLADEEASVAAQAICCALRRRA